MLFTRSKALKLPDLPPELFVTHIFPNLGSRELARLLRVNVRLNSLVQTYLIIISSLRLRGRKTWGTCTKNCFKFMASRTTKLVTIDIGRFTRRSWNSSIRSKRRHSCITSKDFVKVIKRNPNLKRIDLAGVNVSHETRVFTELKQYCTLKSLALAHNDLKSVDPDELAAVVVNIEEVDLTDSHLSSDQVTAVLKRAEENTKLKKLHMKHNRISQVEPAIVTRAREVIEELDIDSDFEDDYSEAARQAPLRNPRMLKELKDYNIPGSSEAPINTKRRPDSKR